MASADINMSERNGLSRAGAGGASPLIVRSIVDGGTLPPLVVTSYLAIALLLFLRSAEIQKTTAWGLGGGTQFRTRLLRHGPT